MHESLRLYDTSLAILAQETEALDNEEEERLAELCQKRAAVMEEAWQKRAGCDPALILGRLKTIQKAQSALAAKAKMQTETLRLALKNSKQESNRLAGYGKAVGNGQTMSMLRKEG